MFRALRRKISTVAVTSTPSDTWTANRPVASGPGRRAYIDWARALAVLCTDDARLVTGASIAIDGGVTAGLLASNWIHRGAKGSGR